MIKLFTFLFLIGSSVSVFAQSLSQIQQEINNGNYSLAESEIKQGLIQHPNSARGYYDLAYVEYKLNNLGEARTAIAKCRSLDPTLSFAHNSSEVYQLINQLEGTRQSQSHSSVVTSSPYAYVQHPQSSQNGVGIIGAGFIFIGILLLVGVIFVIGIIGYFFSSRRSYGPSYPVNNGINNPMYNNVNPPFYNNPPIVQQGNTTTSFLEGLALGGVGGALLDETLRPRTDIPPQVIEEQRTYVEPPTQDPNIPFDSGNNDSWSDNGSSSDAGSSSNNSDW